MSHYREVFNNISTGIILISLSDLSVADINSYARKLFLIDDSEKIEFKDIVELICIDESEDLFSISSGGGIDSYFRRRDGSFFYGELNITELQGSDYLMLTVVNAEKSRIVVEKLKNLQSSVYSLSDVGDVIFESQSMREIYRQCMALHREKSVNVLVEGETGTGKEIVARLIHFGKGDGRDSPFVALNCPAIPENLFESELFGFVKGAFTGADSSRAGKIEFAENGTIFFDEIGEIPVLIQSKLLRLIQEREFYRLGSTVRKVTNARFIAATNRELAARIKEGEFRSDLYYRFNVCNIKIPPLRERKEDIERLSYHFINNAALERNRSKLKISSEVMDIFLSYSWPGNVRELKHIIDKIVVNSDNDVIKPEDIVFNEQYNGVLSPEDVFRGKFNLPDDGLDLDLMNRIIVREVLNKFNGNKGKTADYLGLTRSSLRSRL